METYIIKKKDNKLFLFKEEKEIGEISSEATWVKEDDEFDKSEIREPMGFEQFYTVKGPCGHFH